MSGSCSAQSSSNQIKDAAACNRQAVSLVLEGRLDEAVAYFEKAVELQPDSEKAHGNLANLLSCQGKYECALTSYQKALCVNPAFVQGYVGRATTLLALGKFEEAVSSCKKALQIEPRNAVAHNNLGAAYKALGKLPEAVSCYEQALRYQPHFAEAMNNLGAALAGLNKLEKAAAYYREALRIKPDYADAYFNLGLVLIKWQKWDEAVVVLQQAVALRPTHAEAQYSLGSALMEQGKPRMAGECFLQALALRPEYARAHYALAHSELQRGNLERGWSEYEWRLRIKEFLPRQFREPQWDGSSLSGRTILLHAEQGIGDTMHFVRYAPLVKAFGGTVLLECPGSLEPLLQNCPGIDRVVRAGSELPVFDVQAPLLSLPRILKTTLSNVPADIPYLSAPSELVARWQGTLKRYPGFKIGIAWQGNPHYSKDSRRSITIVEFAALARVEGICLISLQKGPGTDQLAALANNFPVIDLGPELDESGAAFLDTAAVMKNLDLVITADTAVAHLAGALGVPVWLALAFIADWRWLQQRADSPWYPSMRIFRQPEPGSWQGVFQHMAEELPKQMDASQRRSSYSVDIPPGEVIDKATVLELKLQRASDPATLARLKAELDALQPLRERILAQSTELAPLARDLEGVNRLLWGAEDEIRVCEQAQCFGSRFVELARSIYQDNDHRSMIKKAINRLLGSTSSEEKIYSGKPMDSPANTIMLPVPDPMYDIQSMSGPDK